MDSQVLSIAATDLIFVGRADGKLSVCDTRTQSVVSQLDCHPEGVHSIAVEDKLLVTCGLANKQGVKVFDNNVRIYDLRAMRMVMPIPMPWGASSVHIRSNAREQLIYAFCPSRNQISITNINACAPTREFIHVSPG